MKKTTALLFALIVALPLAAQLKQDPQTVVRRLADNIVANTSWRYIDHNTGKSYDRARDEAISDRFRPESPYNVWRYENGVLAIAMVDLSDALGDPKYGEYARRNADFYFDNAPVLEKHYTPNAGWVEWQRMFRLRELDDCGAMAASLLDIYALAPRADYLEYIRKADDHILNRQSRLEDGTFCRPTPRKDCLWADDLYMSVPYLARMGKHTGDGRYFDEAVRQVRNFHRYLWNDRKQLYHHGYWSDEQDVSVAHWGRCNGWIVMAKVELLKFLPENDPRRAEIVALLLQQIKGAASYQAENGLWHQVLDRCDSYLETSVTAMYVYAIAYAVNHGWIPAGYMKIAQQGWDGLAGKINAKGELEDTCMGTGLHEDIIYYFQRKTPLNDIHGLGPAILAGAEMARAQKAGTLSDIHTRY